AGLNRVARAQLRAFEDPEWQAWTFAEAILMPRRTLRMIAHLPVSRVADLYGVSAALARTRLRKLGLQVVASPPGFLLSRQWCRRQAGGREDWHDERPRIARVLGARAPGAPASLPMAAPVVGVKCAAVRFTDGAQAMLVLYRCTGKGCCGGRWVIIRALEGRR